MNNIKESLPSKREMKKNDEIFNVWSFNFKFSENGDVNKVYHLSDIDYFMYEDSIVPSDSDV